MEETEQRTPEILSYLHNINNIQTDTVLMDELPDFLSSNSTDIIILNLSNTTEAEVDLLVRVRTIAQELPIIVITSEHDDKLAIEMVKLGAQDYLIKDKLDVEWLKRSIYFSIERNKLKAMLRTTVSSKNKLLSIISHDLRSPFFSLMETTKFLADNLERYTPEKLREFIMALHNASANTYKMVESLLLWANAQGDRIECKAYLTELYPIVLESLLAANQQAKEKQIQLHNNIDQTIMIYADKDMTNTIIRNIITNAIKFTPTGGNVWLEALKVGEKVEIHIIDDGVGMSPQIKDNLFQIETKKSTKGTNGERGTGLGLVVCWEFVKKNNGRISVQSELNKGTEFIITLPAINKRS
ncbi:ATP-binding response regulator [Spirochaeta cellobiosiphila]|uniref:ATP-binding response regulator n=1 Tax=Spirochaeta cellobiosiphila TaxID=504483 RepID=UPI00146EF5E8|nr:hybrid sensor histidine kinase/response regulator [Spirochaeta cellobiosiphila]